MKGISSTAIVYAAGFGTRMGELTQLIPKPLLHVGGKTLLDRALDVVSRAGIPRAVVNIHYRGDMVRHALKSRTSPKIIVSDESNLILETGGGLKNALQHFDAEAVLTLNSDIFWQGADPFQALSDHWNAETMDALLLLAPVAQTADPQRKGDFELAPNGQISWPNPAKNAAFMYTGAQIIKTDAFRNWPEQVFSTLRIWHKLLENSKCFGVVYQGTWLDVGDAKALALANKLAAE